MNVYETANENSSLYKLLEETVPITSPYEYSIGVNFPAFHRAPRSAVAVTGALGDTDFTDKIFRQELPRFGILEQMWLDINYNFDSTGITFGPYKPLNLFQRFELRTRDKILLTLHPRKIIEWTNRQHHDKRVLLEGENHLAAEGGTEQAEGGEESNLFSGAWSIPLPFSCFDNLKKAFDLRYSEPVFLWIYTRPQSQAYSAADAGTTFKLVLQCFFQNPNVRETARLKRSMEKAGNKDGVPILHWSTYEEDFPMGELADPAATTVDASSTLTERYDLKCPYPTFQTVIQVHCNTGTSGYDITGTDNKAAKAYYNYAAPAVNGTATGSDRTDLKSSLHIASIQIIASGTTFYSSNPRYQGLLENAYGHYRNTNEYLPVLNWNLNPDPTEQTGFVSWKNIDHPQLEMSYAQNEYSNGTSADTSAGATVANSNRVKVTHSYYYILSCAPDDGLYRIRLFT